MMLFKLQPISIYNFFPSWVFKYTKMFYSIQLHKTTTL